MPGTGTKHALHINFILYLVAMLAVLARPDLVCSRCVQHGSRQLYCLRFWLARSGGSWIDFGRGLITRSNQSIEIG